MLGFNYKNALFDQTIEAALALSRRLGQPLRQGFRLPQQDAEVKIRVEVVGVGCEFSPESDFRFFRISESHQHAAIPGLQCRKFWIQLERALRLFKSALRIVRQ